LNNYINFKDYNDYELIYLIKDGNEIALNCFFEKYEKFITKIVRSYIYYKDERFDDFVQEGRILLYECIYRYDDSSDTSFFTYFSIILKRKIIKQLQLELKENYILCEDSVIDYSNKRMPKKIEGKIFFTDELKIEIFDNCIIGNITLTSFAKMKNISYHQIYYVYQKMIEELKTIF